MLERENDEPVTVWLNQIKLTSPDKEPGFPAIKVNQVDSGTLPRNMPMFPDLRMNSLLMSEPHSR